MTMRKLSGVLVLWIIILCTIAIGCGKPSSLSDSNYNIAIHIINTVDEYLDLELDVKDAKEQIKYLEKRYDYSSKEDINNQVSGQIIDLSRTISSISFDLSKGENVSEKDKKMVTARNNLARIVGVKER